MTIQKVNENDTKTHLLLSYPYYTHLPAKINENIQLISGFC